MSVSWGAGRILAGPGKRLEMQYYSSKRKLRIGIFPLDIRKRQLTSLIGALNDSQLNG